MTFFRLPPRADQRYASLYEPDRPSAVAARDLTEDLWRRTAMYLDDGLTVAATDDFPARFWEMYLAAGLLDGGVPLTPTAQRSLKAGGPDILVASPHIYVEATVARPGTGPDAVAPAIPMVVRSVPKTQITLRLRAAIEEKHRKYLGYIATQVLTPDDAYVIAVNGAAIPSTRGEPELPWIVNAVFPLGDSVYHFDRETMKIVGHSFAPEHDLVKASGSLVPKDVFLDPTYSGISAVIYCWADEYNAASTPGRDFITVHNPQATVPISRRVLPGYLEYWLEGDQLKWERRGA